MSKTKTVDQIFNSSKKIKPLEVDFSEIKTLESGGMMTSMSSSNTIRPSNIDKATKRKIRAISKNKIIELNLAWINRLTHTESVLREEMTLFWTNHFVCKDNNIQYIQQFNNTLRKHALGNFKDFVNAVSKEASMVKYLNTKQNKKQNPNENFAGELMKLKIRMHQ